MEIAAAILLPLLAAGATFSIWLRDPLGDYAYELGVLILACVIFLARGIEIGILGWPLAAIAAWGFAQLALGASVHRWATLHTALRFAALAATAAAARIVFRKPHFREAFLCGFAWFGFGISVVSVMAYYTSPGMVLWLWASPYPDVWGPFLSRNNFAQFLELAMPVALFLGLSSRRVYLLLAAAMLAAGLASASRAGALLLLAEAILALLIAGRRARRRSVWFAAAAALCIAVVGAETLVARFHDPDPLLYRREIFRSTLAMIAQRPWTGYGLGTFPAVYPEFASFDIGAVVEHAHNDWLEWAAEGGIPFALVWAVFAIALCRSATRSIWGLGIVSAFLHAVVDYPFARLGVAAWIFLIIGALGWGAVEKKPPRPLIEKRSIG